MQNFLRPRKEETPQIMARHFKMKGQQKCYVQWSDKMFFFPCHHSLVFPNMSKKDTKKNYFLVAEALIPKLVLSKHPRSQSMQPSSFTQILGTLGTL